MINKQNLWFVTLFSLILVLSIYYITMPNELLLKEVDEEIIASNNDEQVSLEVEENDILVSLRLDLEENRQMEIKSLQSILTNVESTIDEKNEAYNKINYLNSVYGNEEKLEKKVKDKLGIDSFIEINNNEINVIGISNNHDVSLANDIMRCIQEEYETKVYVTVSFK